MEAPGITEPLGSEVSMDDARLAYDAGPLWLAAFLRAKNTKQRFALTAELPVRLSRGWRRLIEQAGDIATADGQTSVRRRLERRLERADTVADDGTEHKVYCCTSCGRSGHIDHFGTRKVPRSVTADPKTGAPQLRPHWTVVSCEPHAHTPGKFSVLIQVRQAQCMACRRGHHSEDDAAAYFERKDMGAMR